MNKITTLVLLLLNITSIGWSQTKEWSLHDCMLYATKNNFEVKRADINYRNAKLNHTGRILNQLPSLSGGINAGSNFGRGIDPETNTYINTATFSNGASINTSISVFNGLYKVNETRSAKIAKLRGIEQIRKTEDDVALRTMMAYIDVIYNKSLVDITKKKIENSQLNLHKTQRMEDLGTKTGADVAQIESELASEELMLISNQNKLELSLIQLKDLMNYPLDSILEIDSEIPIVELIDKNQSTNEIYAEAIKLLPQSIISKHDLEVSRLALQTAKWSLLPNLNMGAGVGTSYYTNLTNPTNGAKAYGEQLRDNIGESISVSMGIPIFNGLGARFNKYRAKNNFTQAQNDYSESQRQIQSEISQAVMECQSAEKQLAQAEKGVKAQQLAHQINQHKYDKGVREISIIELQLSANRLFSSQIELVYARLKYAALCRQVNYYKGVPYI